jgi:hypothetical protein
VASKVPVPLTTNHRPQATSLFAEAAALEAQLAPLLTFWGDGRAVENWRLEALVTRLRSVLDALEGYAEVVSGQCLVASKEPSAQTTSHKPLTTLPKGVR